METLENLKNEVSGKSYYAILRLLNFSPRYEKFGQSLKECTKDELEYEWKRQGGSQGRIHGVGTARIKEIEEYLYGKPQKITFIQRVRAWLTKIKLTKQVRLKLSLFRILSIEFSIK